MRKRSDTAIPIWVRDISLTGFRADWPNRIQKEELVWLRLPGLEAREAKVVWSDAKSVGCQFLTPLHEAVLQAILQKG